MKKSDYAICLFVYKHRVKNFLQRLNEIDSKYDIYIVTQTDDPALEEYNQYLVADNIHTLCMPAEREKNIFTVTPSEGNGDPYKIDYFISFKREFARCKMSELGYKGYFQIDDDIAFDPGKITEESKRTTSDTYHINKCSINEMLDKLIQVSKEYNCAFVSPLNSWYLGFQKPGKVNVNSTVNIAQFYYMDVETLDKHNIHYETNHPLSEDTDIVFQLVQHNEDVASVADYGFYATNMFTVAINSSTLYRNNEDLAKIMIGTALKWNMDLRINKQGQLVIGPRKFKQYKNTFDLPKPDEKLLEVCKTWNVQKVYDYVKEREEIKKSKKK